MKVHPSEVGARAEAAVAAALVNIGEDVFVPLFSAHSRMDLVFGDKAGLHRVQCKSAALRGDVLVFRTSSNPNRAPRDYYGEVDFFGVYSADLGRVFLVPVDAVLPRYAHLRLASARNGQSKGIRFAMDYLIDS